MPAEEKTGYAYVPNGDAWEKYRKEGGHGEIKARSVSMQHEGLVQLTGLPSYWWKLTDLLPCMPSTPQLPPAPQFMTPATINDPIPGEAKCCIEGIPDHRLSSQIHHGDLVLEFEEEENEDCSGEDCDECGGEGCKYTPESISASELLEHLLDSYDNNAESFAEARGIERSSVDDLYRDLIVLVGAIRRR